MNYCIAYTVELGLVKGNLIMTMGCMGLNKVWIGIFYRCFVFSMALSLLFMPVYAGHLDASVIAAAEMERLKDRGKVVSVLSLLSMNRML